MSQSADGTDTIEITAQEVATIPPVVNAGAAGSPTTLSPEADLSPSKMWNQVMIQAQVMKMKVRCRKHGEEEKKR